MKKYENDIIKWRRDLHQIPEIGLDLPNTVSYVSKVLDSFGLDYKYFVNGNALVATIEGDQKGKTIALRADMDALPIIEETNLDFSSKNENMHACGHDGHTAMLLGAAKYLINNKSRIKGKVKLLFQPGEEGYGGANIMVNEAVLKNPDVDAIFGIHNGNISPGIESGKIGFKEGKMMASSDTFRIKVKGKGGHGAIPSETIDPILIASEIIIALQSIVSRELKSSNPAVISTCIFNAGTAKNIIPDFAEIEGTVRALDEETRQFIAKRIKNISNSIANMRRGDVDIEYNFLYPALNNDEKFTKMAKSIAEELFPGDTFNIEKAIMGAEDMSFFLQEIPGTFALLQNPGLIDDNYYPHHHPKFDIDEKYLYKGAKLLVEVAISYLDGGIK